MLNGGAISWRSRRQDPVSLSTSEAEYIAASQCGQEVVYLREIICESLYAQTEETLVYEDNRGCVCLFVSVYRYVCVFESVVALTSLNALLQVQAKGGAPFCWMCTSRLTSRLWGSTHHIKTARPNCGEFSQFRPHQCCDRDP